MDVSFINGATVNRCYADDGTELLAHFQYESDAIEFAKMKLAEYAPHKLINSFYVVHNTYNGKMTMVRHKDSP